jgi:hypothetical protein
VADARRDGRKFAHVKSAWWAKKAGGEAILRPFGCVAEPQLKANRSYVAKAQMAPVERAAMPASFILGRAVAIAVLCAAGMTPAFAQYSGNPPPQHADSYRFGAPSLVRGDLVWNPALQLIAAPVLGPDGRWIGLIRVLQPGPDGSHADRIQIVFGSGATFWVKAWRIQYDSDAHVAFLNLTREDVLRMRDAEDDADPM